MSSAQRRATTPPIGTSRWIVAADGRRYAFADHNCFACGDANPIGMHLHIELDGWQVLARDLDSRGGTMLTMPGRPAERMRAREAYVLEPGATLDLAEVYEVRFESGPAAGRVEER